MSITTSMSKPIAKVMVLITEDWFALSHFRPLLAALVANIGDVTVVTTSSGRDAEIVALGARMITLDFRRASSDPVWQVKIVRRLMHLIATEKPDVVHAIALKPIALGGLVVASARLRRVQPKFVMHLTGVGFSGTAAAGRTPLIYAATLGLMSRLLRTTNTALLVENPDDAVRVAGRNWATHGNVTILGGAGVDPALFPAVPMPDTALPVAGFLGRMVWTKGVDVLIEAHRITRDAGIDLSLMLGGTPDPANPRAFPQAEIRAWGRAPHVNCVGHVTNVPAFWAATNIAVVPSRGGEGLPRALLEAASTGRPLVVTGVPGCRYFVRHEREGLIVPPDDAMALAAALQRLAGDPLLAQRLGQNARARLLDGFTERHVAEAVVGAYRRLLK